MLKSIFVGQTEAPLTIKPYLSSLTRSELHSIMTGGFATIAGGVMAAYISFGIPAEHLLTASVMSAPAALAVSKLFYPETEKPLTQGKIETQAVSSYVNSIDAITTGTIDGLKLALNVGAMLIAFMGLLTLFNAIFGWVGSQIGMPYLSLEWIFSYIMFPIAWLMGIPWADCQEVAVLLGKKLIFNEFVAYLDLQYKLVERVYADERFQIERAIDEATSKTRLIKTINSEFTPTQVDNWLEKDYLLLREIGTKTIIKPHKLENHRQNSFLVLENFAGLSFTKFLGERTINLSDFLKISIQLAEVLEKIHQHDIIHQNIQPSSILIDPVSLELKIVDFSLATKVTAVVKVSEQALGLNTAYIAPEQTGRMNISLDRRADFYSLGILLYRLIVGILPFKAQNSLRLIHCHLAQTPIAPHHLNSEISETILLMIAKLLAKNPDDRYQSASAIKADLENCQAQYHDRALVKPFELGRLDGCSQFSISTKLYGRSTARKAIADFLARINSEIPEILLLTGDSGIGKTALVNRVIPTIIGKNGYFIHGNFTSLTSDTPYKAITQALRGLIQQLLTETTESRQLWQEKILAAIASSGKVITNILPELELIIGSQPEVPKMPSLERKNRFNNVFVRFLQVFARPKQPLVLFLDDLQWADSDSLNLIELLLGDRDVRHLRIVGAYRPNEVDLNHSLFQTIKNIAQTVQIESIALTPLRVEEINCLLVDTLNCGVYRIIIPCRVAPQAY